MMRISEASNTLIPAALALEQLGFAVEATPQRTTATSNSLEVVASDPLTALALVTLAQVRGENWQASDSQIGDWLPRLVSPDT
jgi:hypothetical protein